MAYGLTPSLAQEPASSPTPDERERFAQLAAAFMETYEVPGLSVAIAIKGKPAYVEAFGVADRDTGEALTPQHRFRIASISKPITSTGIFTLIEAGKLQLDSHVFGPNSILGDDYPTPLQHRSNIEQITIDHLLTHTTGGWQNDAGDPMGFDKKMNHRELIAFALEHNDLTNPPGKSFAYSNFGYCLLGRVIEKLTGQTYETRLTQLRRRAPTQTAAQVTGMSRSSRLSSYQRCAFLSILQALSSIDALAPAAQRFTCLTKISWWERTCERVVIISSMPTVDSLSASILANGGSGVAPGGNRVCDSHRRPTVCAY
jgi:Beta-lactamase